MSHHLNNQCTAFSSARHVGVHRLQQFFIIAKFV
jgi:hypothetical protein